MEKISVGEAKGRFSELISRAAAGERFVIQRRERSVAVLVGPQDLERLERTAEAARRLALALGQSAEILKEIEAGEAHPAMAAYGLWKGPELEALTAEVYANRDNQIERDEVKL